MVEADAGLKCGGKRLGSRSERLLTMLNYNKFAQWALMGLAGFGPIVAVGRSQAPAPIKVGEYASLTGKEAGLGTLTHHGTVMAVQQINATGGLLGRQIELLTEDTESKPGESGTAVRKLIARDKVVAVLGEVASSRSLEGAPICQAAKIPMISPASTNARVTAIGNYIFRVCFIDPFQGPVMAKFALQTLKVRRIAILSSASSAYSVGLAKYFKAAFLAGGGQVVAEPRYSEGDKDFAAQLTAIRAAGAEAIFCPGYYAEGALIAKQARDLGIRGPVFGGDSWENQALIDLGGPAVEGAYLCAHFSPENPSPRARQFVADYRRRFPGEEAGTNAALGYDSVMVLADAIRRAGTTDHAALRDALAGTTNFDAVTGRITIDAHRDASKAAIILTVRNGRFQFVESVSP
jgi:branched-chain amino acid transport system substrate-binding protein